MFGPLVLLIALGTVFGLVGVIANLRGLESSAEAMVCSILSGIMAGAVFDGIDMIIPVATAFAVIIAVALTSISRPHISEAGVAAVLTSPFSIGVTLLLKKGDQPGQLEAPVFGRLPEVADFRLTNALIVCAVALVLTVVTWRQQVSVVFDRFGAKAAGVNVWGIGLAINVAVAAVVMPSISTVGVLLIAGYLVVPGAAARLLARQVHMMIPTVIAVGCLSGTVGLALVPLGPVSSQAAVALALVGLYFAALGLCVVIGGEHV